MKIAVLGAGVVGVTTAYYLAERGHEVTVIDRAHGVALETSFANGGQIAAHGSAPWAAPGVPWQALKWLGRVDAPLKWTPRADISQWAWLAAFLRRCTKSAYAAGVARNLALGQLSLAELQRVRATLSLDYHQQTGGILKVAKSTADLQGFEDRAHQLSALGANVRYLAASECVRIEPALEAAVAAGEVRGGIHFVDDESGDAHLFTQRLAEAACGMGVRFSLATTVSGFETHSTRITAVRTEHGTIPCDQVVICLGVGSVALARQLGVRLPIYPVKGYSVTVAAEGSNMCPRISLTDEERRIVVTRLGTQVRVAGTAELAGYDVTIDHARAASLRQALNALLPALHDGPQTQVWAGLRPMTPDGGPVLGRAGAWQNLILNTGHGTYGWTMACGSARIVADIVENAPLAAVSAAFGLKRFGGWA